MLKRLHFGVLAAAILFCALTQTSAQPSPPPTLTNKILAIGTIVPGADLERVQRILPSEMRATAQLYLDGKIDQWYSLMHFELIPLAPLNPLRTLLGPAQGGS